MNNEHSFLTIGVKKQNGYITTDTKHAVKSKKFDLLPQKSKWAVIFCEEEHVKYKWRERESEGMWGHTTALKRVDLPTLGRPTMPALRLMLILDEEAAEKRRRPVSMTPIISW